MKRIKLISAVVTFTTLLGEILWGCEDFSGMFPKLTYTFYNNSNDTIFVMDWEYFNENDSALMTRYYFDTEFDGWKCKFTLNPHDSIDRSSYPGLHRGGYPIRIMVFKKSTLDKYTPSEIIEKNITDSMYVLEYGDFVASQFKVVYK